MTEKTYRISGMHCAACSVGIEKFLSRQPGVETVSVNLITEKMTAVFDDAVIGSDDIMSLVRKISYGCEEYVPAVSPAEERRKQDALAAEVLAKQKKEVLTALCFAIPLLYVSMGHMLGAPLPSFLSSKTAPLCYALLQFVLTVPILVLCRQFYLSGFPALRRGRPNMDSLVAVGTAAAFLYSLYLTVCIALGRVGAVHNLCFESSAIVVALVRLGKYLEAISKHRTSASIEKLTELAPETARVTRYGETAEIPAAELRTGDTVTVLPGERFPCDGTISSGESTVDLSMLTGESRPVVVAPGETVTGGSINLDGMLVIEATRVGADTALGHIIRMVEDAQAKKAPIAKLADKIAGWFVPAVMGIALISALVWALAGKDFDFVLNIFVSVLVIACPCSLGLATPTAIMAGTGRGAELKILYKSGEALQALASVAVAVLDKTGTVTKGKPEVTAVKPEADVAPETLVSLAAAAECGSVHPIAESILTYAKDAEIEFAQPEESTVIPGKGLRASVGDSEILCGNASLMTENNICFSYLDSEGATVIYVARDNQYLGSIEAKDSLKEESASAIESLRSLGIRCIVVTGDNESTAKDICEKAGIDEYRADVLPDGKAAVLDGLRTEGKTLAMVGDGINDAPALANADVGIAIGSGTDVAIESGDVVLMGSELTDLVTAVRLSRAVIRNIRENLFWAFFYNCCGIPFAAGLVYALGGPTLPPMFAGACMALSSITVVSNALRLKRFR